MLLKLKYSLKKALLKEKIFYGLKMAYCYDKLFKRIINEGINIKTSNFKNPLIPIQKYATKIIDDITEKAVITCFKNVKNKLIEILKIICQGLKIQLNITNLHMIQ